MKTYLIDRLREPTTWRGFVFILTALGVSISPDLSNQIIAAGTAIAGVIGVATQG